MVSLPAETLVVKRFHVRADVNRLPSPESTVSLGDRHHIHGYKGKIAMAGTEYTEGLILDMLCQLIRPAVSESINGHVLITILSLKRIFIALMCESLSSIISTYLIKSQQRNSYQHSFA